MKRFLSDPCARTPLLAACVRSRLEIIKILVKQGANPNLGADVGGKMISPLEFL